MLFTEFPGTGDTAPKLSGSDCIGEALIGTELEVEAVIALNEGRIGDEGTRIGLRKATGCWACGTNDDCCEKESD